MKTPTVTAKTLLTALSLLLMSGFVFGQTWLPNGASNSQMIYRLGKVGIGTPNPQATLHIGYGYSGQTPTNVAGLFAENNGSSNGWYVFQTATVGGGKSFSVTNAGNVGIGTTNPQEKLHVAGRAKFDLTTGSIAVTTPGGWPGMIATSPNGHRRDIIFDDNSVRLLTSTSSSPSPATNGITIRENGNVGIGTKNPGNRLHISSSVAPGVLLQNPQFPTGLQTAGMIFSGLEGSLLFGRFNDAGNTMTRADVMIQASSGNVGIGETAPQEKLHVGGGAKFDVGGGSITVTTPGGWPGMIATSQNGHRRDIVFDDDGLRLLTSSSSSASLANNGIRIRENGTVYAKEIVVHTKWSDFVFAEDYDLMPLNEVAEYINQNNHLPDVPSEAEVTENGVSLGEMQSRLLQKIEELTLYVIDLKKENDELKMRVASLEN